MQELYRIDHGMSIKDFEDMNHIVLMSQFFDINKTIKFGYELYDGDYIGFVKEEFLTTKKELVCEY